VRGHRRAVQLERRCVCLPDRHVRCAETAAQGGDARVEIRTVSNRSVPRLRPFGFVLQTTGLPRTTSFRVSPTVRVNP